MRAYPLDWPKKMLKHEFLNNCHKKIQHVAAFFLNLVTAQNKISLILISESWFRR